MQVLTSNIGHILGIIGVENGIDEFRSTASLTFEQYRFYLNNEIFNQTDDMEVCKVYHYPMYS